MEWFLLKLSRNILKKLSFIYLYKNKNTFSTIILKNYKNKILYKSYIFSVSLELYLCYWNYYIINNIINEDKIQSLFDIIIIIKIYLFNIFIK